MSSDKSNKLALVILSGGQDSVTCFGYAREMHQNIAAISFNYGQRHKIELECAARLCAKYQVPWKLVQLGDLLSSLVSSALTGTVGLKVTDAHPKKPGLPASFVPGRNALFLTLAHAHAQEIGADVMVTGVCQTDYSGYPDCRDDFIRAMAFALNTGYETHIAVLAPLMGLTKAQTFMLAEEMNFLPEVIEGSHTCYEGDHHTRHAWGYGCGKCPACILRAGGYEEYIENKSKLTLPPIGSD